MARAIDAPAPALIATLADDPRGAYASPLEGDGPASSEPEALTTFCIVTVRARDRAPIKGGQT